MSEEIIIDGVNVAECAFYKLGVCISPINKNCKDCNDIDINKCYFKQLKRLQIENEELKKENEILLGQLVINDGEDVTVQISQSQFDEYNELKAENERLKDDKNRYELYIKEERDNNYNYRKALEEIRGITKMFYNSALNAIATGTNIDRTGAIIKIQEICGEVLKDV